MKHLTSLEWIKHSVWNSKLTKYEDTPDEGWRVQYSKYWEGNTQDEHVGPNCKVYNKTLTLFFNLSSVHHKLVPIIKIIFISSCYVFLFPFPV